MVHERYEERIGRRCQKLQVAMIIRKNRAKLCVILLLIGFMLAVLLLTDCHIVLVGTLRGERFYRGRPSSYWSSKIKSGQFHFSWGGDVWYENDMPIYYRGPTWIRQLLQAIGFKWQSQTDVPRDQLQEEFVMLFVDLMKDKDSGVRQTAARGLAAYDPVNNEVISALIAALLDEDERVRSDRHVR